jgi:hypothetical protein
MDMGDPRLVREGSGIRVQGSGFRVQGSGFRVQGSGFRVQKARLHLYRTRAIPSPAPSGGGRREGAVPMHP